MAVEDEEQLVDVPEDISLTKVLSDSIRSANFELVNGVHCVSRK